MGISAPASGVSYVAFNAGTKDWNNTSFVMSIGVGGVTGYMGVNSAFQAKVNNSFALARLERSPNRIQKSVEKMRNGE
ncbi:MULTISPECIES: hypothetical protein [Streptomyces]|uniref:Uncharacterized protein n=1 Tax=Streptomyces silvae TaxID=2803812 RepID=A0ABU7ZUA8_9ACTN|nr:hypothetical protein [Streptomyces sp. ME02-6979-3A]MDX3327380.1 hypothetical protein [Streptomyces sp. ME02-6979-3A]WSS59766.1 hypothetical protein OG284_00245 [Streptomyces sp. NBC_01177]